MRSGMTKRRETLGNGGIGTGFIGIPSSTDFYCVYIMCTNSYVLLTEPIHHLEIATKLLAVSDLLWRQILKELWTMALGVVLLYMYAVSMYVV